MNSLPLAFWRFRPSSASVSDERDPVRTQDGVAALRLVLVALDDRRVGVLAITLGLDASELPGSRPQRTFFQ